MCNPIFVPLPLFLPLIRINSSGVAGQRGRSGADTGIIPDEVGNRTGVQAVKNIVSL
jgi:hypothetical protein